MSIPDGITNLPDQVVAVPGPGVVVIRTTVTFVAVPAAPTISVVSTVPGRAGLLWGSDDPTITGFAIERTDPGGDVGWTFSADASNPGSTTDETVQPGQTYTYSATCSNVAGTSPPSDPASVTIPPPPPNAPTAVKAEATDPFDVSVSWSWDGDPATLTKFVVCRCSPDPMQFEVTGRHIEFVVQPGVTYTYKVKAVGPGGESPCSDPATVTTPVPPPPVRTLRAVVTLGGQDFEYAEAGGADLGDYVSGAPYNFTQRCVRARNPGIPALDVYFRPDRDSDRVEVVFELGRLWAAANAAAAPLGAYTAKIYRGDTLLATVAAPGHWWDSSWRWQSAPRPVVRTVADLVAAKLILPLVDEGHLSYDFAVPVSYSGPMGTAGIAVGMPGPGARGDIGVVTDWQAAYQLRGTPRDLANVLAQAEAAGSMPYRLRDEATGAPLDTYAHPKAHWWQTNFNGSPEYIKTLRTTPAAQRGWNLHVTHMPNVTYLPYLLTGDPYYLEAQQFQVNWSLALRQYYQPTGAITSWSAERDLAWGLRDMAQCAAVTPDAVPSWLLPKSCFARALADNLAYHSARRLNNPDPQYSRFAALSGNGAIAHFMDCYLCWTLCHMLDLGFEGWRPFAEWKYKSIAGLTSNTSGWPGQYCSPYYFQVAKGTLSNPSFPASEPDWGSAYRDNIAYPIQLWTDQKLQNPFPPYPQYPANGGRSSYVAYTRAALALGIRAGLRTTDPAGTDLRGCWSYFKPILDDQLGRLKAPIECNQAFPTPAPAPEG